MFLSCCGDPEISEAGCFPFLKGPRKHHGGKHHHHHNGKGHRRSHHDIKGPSRSKVDVLDGASSAANTEHNELTVDTSRSRPDRYSTAAAPKLKDLIVLHDIGSQPDRTPIQNDVVLNAMKHTPGVQHSPEQHHEPMPAGNITIELDFGAPASEDQASSHASSEPVEPAPAVEKEETRAARNVLHAFGSVRKSARSPVPQRRTSTQPNLRGGDQDHHRGGDHHKGGDHHHHKSDNHHHHHHQKHHRKGISKTDSYAH